MITFAILGGVSAIGFCFMARALYALNRDIDRENDQGWS